ncbi:ABC transporter substrate-binding protein [Billgrantia gudaonensis]|uniref:Peptide/nickel transport system substrate-binding protein n=1 Tax=Billgrantia gudaonensis TaxID=376427 RepID=A0A1G8MX00_9GAMM|nr:ABC transporter substrate-binding protein [Halomonas gudaonensis]SDI72345.1 peptide/nickel transport system substrate-binding protein [Halomonas gudaonensis]
MGKRIAALPTLLLAVSMSLSGVAVAQQSLRVDLQLEPPHLDPTRTPSATTAETVHRNVFQGLTRIDRHGEVRPGLAERWRVSEDGLRYRFWLRKGVRFHDGRRFDAEVAAYSLRRLLSEDAGNPQRQLYRAIREVEVAGSHELVLHLSQPNSLLPFRLGLSAAVMVHPDSVHTNVTRPVGTGPYAFQGWERGSGVRLAAFADYWGQAPAIERATFTFTGNRLELEGGLAEGLIDLYPDASSLTSHMALSLRADYRIKDGFSEGEVILAINHARPPFDDRRVRRALSHAVDREALLDIYPAISPPLIGSHFSPRHPAYVDLVDRYPHDPQRARELLAEAGQAEGSSLTLTVPPTQYAESASLYIAADLEAVGIEVTLERLDWPEWLAQVFNEHDYDLTIVAHVEPMDIDIYARDDYYFNYQDADFKALWKRIEAAQEASARHALLGEAQRHLADEAVNVFLFLKPQQAIHKVGLTGVWSDTPIPAVVLQELAWE